jgi:hypothetical protein
MAPTNTPITVHALALGGKFIGQAVKYAKVEISGAKGVLAHGLADHGLIPGTDGSGITALIMGQPYPWGYPVRTEQAVGFSATLPLSAPEVLSFTVTSKANPRIATSVSRLVIPGVPLTGAAAVVVVLQGLLAELTAPIASTPITACVATPITATIRMMCGCHIDNLFWPAANFTVTAVISGNGKTKSVPLSYSGTPSLFSADFTFPAVGSYEIAIQAAEINGNLGAAPAVGVMVS